MPWVDGSYSWMILALSLFLGTFGTLGILRGFYIIFIVAIFLFGLWFIFLIIAYNYGCEMSKSILVLNPFRLQYMEPGLTKVKNIMQNTGRYRNFDRRMTGASVIDEALQEVLDYLIRDYVLSWYRPLSLHDGFIISIRKCMQKVITTFANKSKEVEWMPYFTQKLVDDFASHIRLYRRANEKFKSLLKDDNVNPDIESIFFDLEVEMEKMCRDATITSTEHEHRYLRNLSEVLLYLLLPKEDFQNKSFRYIIREVLVNEIFIPAVDLLSDPDYINQSLSWLCKEATFNNDTFMTVIKTTDSIEELEAVKEMVNHDIARWRSKDTGGSNDTVIKQNLNSLRFVQSMCDTRMNCLLAGQTDSDLQCEEPEFCKAQNLFVLTLEDILNNNIALSVFIEYMTSIGGEQYLFFYLNVEGFRAAAEEQISAAHEQKLTEGANEPDLESLRRAAMIIYEQYLSEKSTSKIKVDPEICKRTLINIKSKMLTEDAFDEVQSKVFQLLLNEPFYEGFLQSTMYVKLLAELGLLPDSKKDDGSTLDVDDVPRIIWFQPDDSLGDSMFDGYSEASVSNSQNVVLSAQVSQTGIVKESEKSGKSYAVYAITVKKIQSDTDMWDVYRRYSDFHDLHMIITEKYIQIPGLMLPGKTAFKNINKEFLEKRRRGLNAYLQFLMNAELWQSYPGLEDLVNQFLAPGLWEKHKSELARKMEILVNPLRSSVRTVGTAVKHMPDVAEGVGKLFNVKGLTANLPRSEALDSGKVGAGLDPDVGENIPLRILLLLMDEVFDLRQKNQWLRRRLVAILRQLIKATFGDMINRKIVEHVDWMTSAEQMAEYVKTFRDSFWPYGSLADRNPARDENTKLRTRVVCRARMLGSIPDEMRHLMGNETVKIGVVRVFNMFQHKSLNKRLVYVFLEGMLETLFPQNKFNEIFHKLHSKSQRQKSSSCNSSKDPLRRQNSGQLAVR
ncbi:sorting nexin-13 isoform X1 [Octopus sinensis]|uniref:Sorting nexin-13 isoform X1 n=2 Tax=Octopus sinensis TaxID=2607531 RepID=A0A7E6ESW0_9MOLL|nr:sorting nexin-13 isoform X1 [Octopus sinensis]XP_036358431.1 sorting nexin-13 isoform X1 [Octopus sinensis]XP_036358434.1 sorting nexin-13 isoform X1 [Octopus sinensis]